MKTSQVLSLVFYSFTSALHTTGLILLYMVRNKIVETSYIQYVYIVNLSVVELLSSILYVAHTVVSMSDVPRSALYYFHCIQNGGFFVWYTLAMILLTSDRFMEVYLNIRYYLFWSMKKTIIALVVIFIIPLGFTLYLFTLTNRRDIYPILSLYCWPICEFSFIVVAVATYGYFLYKIKRQRVIQERFSVGTIEEALSSSSATTEIGQAPASERKSRFRRATRGFYLPTLLIATYLIFWVFPDMYYFVSVLKKRKDPDYVRSIFSVMYMLAFASDAVIYIFGYKPVRKLIRRKMR